MKINRALHPYLPKVQASHITPKQIGSDRMTVEATSTKDAWGHTLAAATRVYRPRSWYVVASARRSEAGCLAYTQNTRQHLSSGTDAQITQGAQKCRPARPQRAKKARGYKPSLLEPLASIPNERIVTLPPVVLAWHIEPLSHARAPLVDLFSIFCWICNRRLKK